MGKGRRYESNEKKINIKKVIAVILTILVIVIGVYAIKTITSSDAEAGKKTTTNYFPVYTKNAWGVIDSTGKIIIDSVYEEMVVIPNNKKDVFLCVYNVDYENETYKTKALNKKGKEIFEGYEKVEALENYKNYNLEYDQNLLRVMQNGKYGLINYEGQQILECKYDDIKTLKGVENSYIIKQNDKIGLVDNLGKIIIAPTYTDIQPMSDDYKQGYITKNDENKYGLIGFDGNKILEEKYDSIRNITNNRLYYVQEQGQWKIINEEEEAVITNTFDDIIEINSEEIVIKKDGKYGLINTSEEEILPIEYEDLRQAFSKYYIAKKDGKYGLIKTDKTKEIDFKYADIQYREGANFIEAITENFESEIFDTEINLKLIGIISEVNVEKGYMKLKISDSYKYYNFKFTEKKASEVLTTNNLFLSRKNGKYGYLNAEGEIVVDYIYDDAQEQNSYGYVAVKKDGKWGCLDRKGKEVLAPTYELENNLVIDFIGKWHLGLDLNMNYYTDI